jgi:hypothetical protein
MTMKVCAREPDVLQAIAAGAWPADLDSHLAACKSCRDTALVAGALRAEAARLHDAPLPDAGAIWSAAQRGARQWAIDRATRPITLMTRVAGGACAVAAVALVIAFWPVVSEQVAGFARSFTSPVALGAGGMIIAILSVATAATASAAFVLFESWAGE